MNNIKLTPELEELLNQRTDEEKELVLKFYTELIDKCKVAIEWMHDKIVKPIVDLINAILDKFRNHDELIKRYLDDLYIKPFKNKFGEEVLAIQFTYMIPHNDMVLLEYKGFSDSSYDFYQYNTDEIIGNYYLSIHEYIELEEIK